MACEDKLLIIDDAFSDYMMKKLSVAALEKKVAVALSACQFYNKKSTFTVHVVKNNTTEPFFGMRIFPNTDAANKIAEDMVVNKFDASAIRAAWQKIDNWVIEIDSQCFDRSQLSFNPKEITSMLLHEVGHTIYSDKVVERFYLAYKTCYMSMKSAEKDTVKFAYGLFTIPLTTACMLRSWTRGRTAIKEEYFADKIVVDNGYGEHYVSALTKIIEACGNSVVNSNHAEDDAEVESSMNWVMTNICDVKKRKENLKDQLFYRSVKSSSGYLKALSVLILNTLGINLREKYTGDVVECTIETMEKEGAEVAFELCFETVGYAKFDSTVSNSLNNPKYSNPGTPAYEAWRKTKPQKLPSWEELDRIKIEIDKITNHYDRTFVLDLIYDQINHINDFMESIEHDTNATRKYKAEANRMLAELDNYRSMVLARDSFAKHYQVFVKVPDGYEG